MNLINSTQSEEEGGLPLPPSVDSPAALPNGPICHCTAFMTLALRLRRGGAAWQVLHPSNGLPPPLPASESTAVKEANLRR